jgi:hypothetical protein
LLRVHRRVSQQQSLPQQALEYKVKIVKTKGSQISGPLILRVLSGVVGGHSVDLFNK